MLLMEEKWIFNLCFRKALSNCHRRTIGKDKFMATEKKVGLALGGGILRGFVHIGVLEVLEKAKIPIDFVAGTSVGSLVGAFYCAGISPAQIRERSSPLNWWKFIRPAVPFNGWLSFAPLERWIIKELGDLKFSDLKLPFAVAATDLKSGCTVKLDQDRVAPAVRASASIPGLITPLEMNGWLLADGSLSNTVPVNFVKDMGADYVIGVDIFRPGYRPHLGWFGHGFSALEILVQNAGGGASLADCLISPDLAHKTYFRFSRKDQLIALGVAAAEKKIMEIKLALNLS
jgi:NTE family protein